MLLLQNVFTGAISFITVAVIARRLSVDEYGVFSFARSFPLLFLVMSDMGIEFLLIREVAVGHERVRDYIGKLLPLKLTLTFIAVICAATVTLFAVSDAEVRYATLILVCYTFLRSMMTFMLSVFRGLEKMEYVSIAGIIEFALAFLMIYFLLKPGGSAGFVSVLYLASMSCALIMTAVFLIRNTGLPKPAIDMKLWKTTLIMSWPLALNSLSVLLNNNVDIVMIKYFHNREQVGLYAACVPIAGIVCYFQNAFAASVYPVISRIYENEKSALAMSFNKCIKMITITSVPVCLGGAMLAKKILITAFGAKYEQGAIVLAILCGAAFFSSYAAFFSSFATSIHEQKKYGLIYASCTVLNIILNLFLIPRWGITGAAIATILSNAALIISVTTCVFQPFLEFRFKTGMLKIFMSVVIMAIFICSIYNLHIGIIIPIGGIAYCAGIIGTKTLTKQEIDIIKKMLMVKNRN